MKETAVALRYAKAFVDSFEDKATLTAMNGDLTNLAQVFDESDELRAVMLNPAMPFEVKQSTLNEIVAKAGYAPETGKALDVVLVNGRIGIIDVIADQFEKLVFQALGKVRVKVSSASDLSDVDTKSLTEKLKNVTGLEAVMDINVDPSLIGGVVAQVGSVVYDGSIKSQLETLRIKT